MKHFDAKTKKCKTKCFVNPNIHPLWGCGRCNKSDSITKVPTKIPVASPATKVPTKNPVASPTTKVPTKSPTSVLQTTKAPTKSPNLSLGSPTTKVPTKKPTTPAPQNSIAAIEIVKIENNNS